jgi:hypothetical protein
MRATLACVVVFAGLVAAAPVPKADPIPAVTEEHLKASRENLKQIALAFHNHAFANNDELPRNILDMDGKPLLSWRVAILPHLGKEELYKEFKLLEPWDSENNKKLVEKLPELYKPIRVKAPVGQTFYQVFYGEGAVFGPKLKPDLINIPDGVSNTAMVVEAGSPVVWTKPADLSFDVKKALPKLGGILDGEFHAAKCDGSVMLVKKDFEEKEMKAFITPNGGEIIDIDKKLKK